MKRLARQWLRKAEHDVRVARHLFTLSPLLSHEICFHCQQAIEKFLKGMLAERGLPIQKTHDLTILLDHLLPADPALRSLRRGLKGVTRYAVEAGPKRGRESISDTISLESTPGPRFAAPAVRRRRCHQSMGASWSESGDQ